MCTNMHWTVIYNFSSKICDNPIIGIREIDKIKKMNGMDITFVTSANTDEEGKALLKEFGLPFKN